MKYIITQREQNLDFANVRSSSIYL